MGARCLPRVAFQRRGYSAPRFPSPGSLRVKFPGFTGTVKALRLPDAHPAALRFLRLAVPRITHLSLPPPLRAAAAGLGLVARYPQPGFLRGNDRISQVPGEPLFPFAHVLRPRPVDASQTINGTLAWPPMSERRRHRRQSSFRGSIAWLSGSLSTYHGWVALPRARLASRCWSGSPGWACTHRAPTKGFKLTSWEFSSFSKLLDTIRPELSTLRCKVDSSGLTPTTWGGSH